MRLFKYAFLLLFWCPFVAKAQFSDTVNINGIMDGIQEMVTRTQYMVPMHDGVGLATDVFLPILRDDLAFENISFDLFGTPITFPKLKLANKGLQLMMYKNQADPYKLPVVFTRTPYNKSDPTQGQVEAILGYCGIVQDMRGRYASEGVYLPMYSDAWSKTPYLNPGDHHPLDTTYNHDANDHEDGYESVQYIAHSLRKDSNGDSVINELDSLICNGSIGMIGASALANSQISAAAVRKVDTDQPGLKCLFPIVGSGEFYHSTGHQNGVFRERIIDGWLRGQVERYDWVDDPNDNSVYNGVHSLLDYGPTIQYPKQAAESAIDFWTTMFGSHYPDKWSRAVMDVSWARIDENGNGSKTGAYSRYRNLDLPIYHLTGWWDIFIDGQIQTWALTRENITKHKHEQKIVIGPWAHQTIGTRSTGDMRETPDGKDHRYPDNVGQIIGANFDDIDISNLGGVTSSEVIDWFRRYLGMPTVMLPMLDEWQYAGNVLGSELYLKIPADTYEVSFNQFFNFLNGTGPLENFPLAIKGFPGSDSNAVQLLTIPATGTSIFGDNTGAHLDENELRDFNDAHPNSVAPMRFYVVGNVAEEEQYGCYWVNTDTFPIPNVYNQKVYLHQNGTIDITKPTTDEGTISFFADPDFPCATHGGAEMISYTPDNERTSQGQMDFNDPLYKAAVLDRPTQLINGIEMTDLLQFESVALVDSFSFIGIPVVTMYAKSKPLSNIAADSTNCDFIVRLVDVYPDGRQMFIQDGAVNARARDYASVWASTGIEEPYMPWTNIQSDKIYEYKFRMLPIAYTLAKGHKLKVLVSSSNYPRFQACPNVPLEDGEFYRRRPYEEKSYSYHGKTLYPRKALQTLAISDEYAFNIEFPVVGKLFTSRESEKQVLQNNKVVIYPNPTSDVIGISVEKNANYVAQLLNTLGQVVQTQEFNNTLSMNVEKLPRGIYVLNITAKDNNFSASHKVMLK